MLKTVRGKRLLQVQKFNYLVSIVIQDERIGEEIREISFNTYNQVKIVVTKEDYLKLLKIYFLEKIPRETRVHIFNKVVTSVAPYTPETQTLIEKQTKIKQKPQK